MVTSCPVPVLLVLSCMTEAGVFSVINVLFVCLVYRVFQMTGLRAVDSCGLRLRGIIIEKE